MFFFISLFVAIFFTFETIAAQDILSAIKERGKLIVGTKANNPPFSLKNTSGELVGFEIDLAKEIAAYILGSKDKVEFKIIPTVAQRISSIEEGNVDIVIATFSVTPARSTRLIFSQPYYFTTQRVLVNRNKVKSLNHLKGKKVMVIYGSNSASAFFELQPSSEVVVVSTYDEALKRLQKAEVFAFSSDLEILGKLLRQLSNNFTILPEDLGVQAYAIAMKRRAESAGLAYIIDEALDKMTVQGTISKLINFNFERYAPELISTTVTKESELFNP